MEQELEELLREDAPTDVAKISTILAEMKRLQSLHQVGIGGDQYVMTGAGVGPSGAGGALYTTSNGAQDVYQANGMYDQLGGGAHGSLHY